MSQTKGNKEGFLYLESSRLVLRDHREADLESHHNLLSDGEVMRYLPDIRTYSIEASGMNLHNAIDMIAKPNRSEYFFRIEERETGTLVGEVGYTVTEDTPIGKFVHLGYFTHSKFWGKGYMTEAVKRVLEFAFEEGGVYRVTTGCLKENIGSERVMQKCGFVKEAHLVAHTWHEGAAKDRVEYRMLKPEWERRKGELLP